MLVLAPLGLVTLVPTLESLCLAILCCAGGQKKLQILRLRGISGFAILQPGLSMRSPVAPGCTQMLRTTANFC